MGQLHNDIINNKLLVLFILEKLDMPISEEDLAQICSVDNNWMLYFYCKKAIEELATSNFLMRKGDESNPNNHFVSINEDGKTCLSVFFKDIPNSVREEVTTYIRNTKLEYRKTQEFVSTFANNSDGSYKVTCKIMGAEMPIFELNFDVSTYKKAKSIQLSWKDKAPEVYKMFLDTLVD